MQLEHNSVSTPNVSSHATAMHTTDAHTTGTYTMDAHTTDVQTTDEHITDVQTTDEHTTDVQTTDARITDVLTTDAHTTDTHTTDAHNADAHTTDTHTTVTLLTGTKAWEAEGNKIIGAQHTRKSPVQYNYDCAFVHRGQCTWAGRRVSLLGYKKHLKDKHKITVTGYNEDLLPLRSSEQLDHQQREAEDEAVLQRKVNRRQARQEEAERLIIPDPPGSGSERPRRSARLWAKRNALGVTPSASGSRTH